MASAPDPVATSEASATARDSEGNRRVPLQTFLRENMMLILLGAFAALTDWFSFLEMLIDEPSEYTVPPQCKTLLLASAFISTTLLVLRWWLEYLQVNATMVKRMKRPSRDIEMGEHTVHSRLIQPGVPSQASTPRGPSTKAPEIPRFYRPEPPQWLVSMTTFLGSISVCNDSIDLINVVIILRTNPGASTMGTLICNLFLDLLNAVASAYEAMGFEASQQQLAQETDTLRVQRNAHLMKALPQSFATSCGMGAISAVFAVWFPAPLSWLFSVLFWLLGVVLPVVLVSLSLFPDASNYHLGKILVDYSRLGLLHVLIAELVDATTDWITWFTIAMASERVPTWLWRLYLLSPLTGSLMLYPCLVAMLEAKIDAKTYEMTILNRLLNLICEDLLGLVCNFFFLFYPTYQLQLLPIANIILTLAVITCQLITETKGLEHAKMLGQDRLRNLTDKGLEWFSNDGADPNMACGEPLRCVLMIKAASQHADDRLVRNDRDALRIFKFVELLLEAGADPNVCKTQAGGLAVAPLDLAALQLELKDVAALLAANGAKHSKDYHRYGGNTNPKAYTAIVMRSNALQWKKDIHYDFDFFDKELDDEEKALKADLKALADAARRRN
ncbi:unnamed protein product [Vitrella brassicaformis CCMP3155]|uniref:Uncharacterized protein n=1 Tax=Vitrella brassicaformis (strain CCMP3155) TaxID=1169540 RepID=A0A0G4GBT2_VITBC|nr:unnamed protein product [Vitrella brassicaformis CCMP3155]|eukprot:CEM26557.1 unnamed protein product [Vitrella brassicaformis CCMP3155]